jgi:hypothetical protein
MNLYTDTAILSCCAGLVAFCRDVELLKSDGPITPHAPSDTDDKLLLALTVAATGTSILKKWRSDGR